VKLSNINLIVTCSLATALTACGSDDARSSSRQDLSPAPPPVPYHMGADITWVQHDEFYGATYIDTDGVQKDFLEIMKNHGFNSARLRTFVDPKAADGYDQVDGFGDLEHTVAMAQRIKQAGMTYLLSMHYSDNWADPGKQCIPVAWQGDTFEQLTEHLREYTSNAISALKAAGVTPDLVQIGNEITPGMLFSVCDSTGIPLPDMDPEVNGRNSNWANLGTLLKAGAEAVRAVDPKIKIVLHIDKGGDLGVSRWWVQNALEQGVPFDVLADTSYVRWQGEPNAWRETFTTMVAEFPNLSFIIPEYGNETATDPPTPSTMRIANDLIYNLPNHRGLGTWFYEPTHPSQSGIGIGLVQGDYSSGTLADPWPSVQLMPDALAEYDSMKVEYASRLSL